VTSFWKTCEVAIHFNKTPHALEDFNLQCINQINAMTNENAEKLLIAKEAYWSAQLFSLFPYGLNRRQEFHSKKCISQERNVFHQVANSLYSV